MHILTVRTKFTFGDHVHFDSRIQGCSGTGKVFAITVDAEQQVDYIIDLDQGGDMPLQPGILEEEMTLLEDDAEPSA
jgi:hypothetical protein